MSTQSIASRELLAQLPVDSTLILRNVAWEDYEDLLETVGEAPGLRIAYDKGTVQIMTLSPEHESYGRLIERLIDRLSAKLHVKILFFGSSTLKRKDRGRGAEPDACFYVKTAAAIGPKIQLDFATGVTTAPPLPSTSFEARTTSRPQRASRCPFSRPAPSRSS